MYELEEILLYILVLFRELVTAGGRRGGDAAWPGRCVGCPGGW